MVLIKSIRDFLLIWIFLLTICNYTYGQIRIKAMFYNLLFYSNDTGSRDKTPELKTILDEINPDLFMVCELENEIASNYLFTNAIQLHNNSFEKATFQQSNSSISLNQMVYYNTQKLTLETQRVIPTNTRDINHYTFKINTENSSESTIRLEVFVTHLKASQGSTNRQRRLASAEDFVIALEDIPTDSFVLFAGDFNFYSSNEEGYFRLITEQNPIVMIDPINRPCDPFPNSTGNDPFEIYSPSNSNNYFWRSSSFSDIHSQATRGSFGGMDDRFDFIMISQNFNTSSDLFYIENSYETYGNNGNCYNGSVNDISCSGFYSQTVREALFQFSDHLPIIMQLEAPQSTLSTTGYSIPATIIGSNTITDYLELEFTQTHVKEAVIYNSLGQRIQSISIKDIDNQRKISISVQNLSKGIYYLKVDNDTIPLRFIKL